ncbi:MAG: hypothetical protein IT531_19595 [Burkholderiales bacterium]|nr:hypothetical protein [Burkholderiales bacterium]
MAKLITGRFDDIEEVRRALVAIQNVGFARHEYGTFYVTPPGQHHRYPIGGDAYRDAATQDSAKGAAAGAAMGGTAGLAAGVAAAVALPVAGLAAALAGLGVGAYVGSLVGAMSQARHADADDASIEHPVEQPGGVRIAVNVDNGNEAAARQALITAGAEDIVAAEGVWQDGEWKDFDPRALPPTQMES